MGLAGGFLHVNAQMKDMNYCSHGKASFSGLKDTILNSWGVGMVAKTSTSLFKG